MVKSGMMKAVAPLLAATFLSCASVPTRESKEKAPHDTRMEWWREARFGMFIHWGLYAIPAGEWKGRKIRGPGEWIQNNGEIPLEEYQTLQKEFNPVRFDAAKWARIARNAGMGYVVLTAKHIDGFCMYDSKLTDYDVMGTPFERDVMKELASAVRKQGMKMCAYYSVTDFHHPDYTLVGPGSPWPQIAARSKPGDINRYLDYMKGQLRELLTQYGPLGVMWFDACYGQSPEDVHADEMVAMMRAIQPDLIVNNRLGTPEDCETPEQDIPATGFPGRDWETCMTINNTWGFMKADLNWKSTEVLLRNLIDIASKGGNYLLNVGPTAEGEIPEACVERLEEIGRWMSLNGESIHGTTASPFKHLAWGRCTQKPGALYLHVFDWPSDGRLLVPGLESKVKKAYLLSDPARRSLPVSKTADGVAIGVPAQAPDKIASVVVLRISGPLNVAP
jgi:alpha-L-fucosidase